MEFKINKAYLECLDINYDNIYLNRYTDSLNVLNYIVNNESKIPTKLYFNFIDVFNNNLTKTTRKCIEENIQNNDPNLFNLINNINITYPDIVYNNQILYFRNISTFIANTQNLFSLEEYIENLYPHSYLILNSDLDLSAMGYDQLSNNNYIKKLY